jgi:hypothetical protein
MKPILKPPGTKHLKLKCDALLSTFAFEFNLRRYIMELSRKHGNPIYNLLPDLLSRLSGDETIAPPAFQRIMTRLLGFIDKDRQTEVRPCHSPLTSMHGERCNRTGNSSTELCLSHRCFSRLPNKLAWSPTAGNEMNHHHKRTQPVHSEISLVCRATEDGECFSMVS